MKKAQPGQADARIGPSKKTSFIANWLEFGTKPHTIKSKKGKPLYIPGTGFVESIKHPGAAAKPFLRPAFDEQATKVIDQFKTELGSAIEKAAKK